MGLGKSIQAVVLDRLRREKHPDLVKRPKTLVITYISIFSSWVETFESETDLSVITLNPKNRQQFLSSLFNDGHDVYVLHWQVLRLIPRLADIEWFHIIGDECLVAGTPIDTPSGTRTVESLKIGDVVYGYDHEVQKVVPTTVRNTFTHETSMPLFDINGVTMTANHPVWTNESAYVDASMLDSTYHTLLRLENANNVNLRKMPKTVSVQSMVGEGRPEETSILQPYLLSLSERSKENNNTNNEDLRVVSQRVSMRAVSEGQTSLLQYNLFKSVESSSVSQGSASQEYRKGGSSFSEEHPNSKPKSKVARISAFRAQPIQRSGSASESSRNVSGARVRPTEWWDGEAFHSASGLVQSTWSRVDIGVPNSYRSGSWPSLCPGLSKSNGKVGSGDRRSIALGEGSEGSRPEQGRVPSKYRMDNAALHKHIRDAELGLGTPVYNIETGTRNYFANGILVHNCHAAQNRKTKQTIALKNLKTYYKTGLSGTPAYDKPDDLWSILNWLYPKYWSSFWRYYDQHVKYVENNGYRVVVGVNNVEKLQEEMRGFYIRRRKQEVLLDLPAKYYSERIVELDPKQKRAYQQMKKDMLAWVGEHEDEPVAAPVVIAQLTRLQQFSDAYGELEKFTYREKTKYEAFLPESVYEQLIESGLIKRFANPEITNGEVFIPVGTYMIRDSIRMRLSEPSTKLDAVMDILGSTAEQIVVFSQFAQVIELLAARLEKAGIPHGIIVGATPSDDRKGIIRKFQAGKLRVFAGTIAAGGIGITLTSSSTVVFIDRSWSASLNIQAEDRLHRIGQKNAVQVIDIISRDTLDAKRIRKINLAWGWIKKLIGDDTDIEDGLVDYEYDEELLTDTDW